MTATLTETRLTLPMAALGPACPMPRYRWQQPIPSTDTLPAQGLVGDEVTHPFNWGEDSILPYQVQDSYDRDQQPGVLDVLVLENDRFRAQVAPGLGGRLLSLLDKVAGRDLLFANPVFQPANLAALNAWFSGGVEWNGLTPGHSPTTCSPVFAARVDTSRGPVLRLYEFDRTTECLWQVDLFLPPGDAPLVLHGRIVNPNDAPAQVYWWTNIAVATPPGGRVLSPADYSIEHVLPDNHLERRAFPRQPDGSYPGNWEGATSVFFRSGQPGGLICLLDRDGQGVAHLASASLPGRKFFYFGTGPGGQHWMDFLSRPGQGDYVEIQAGITPHQNQRLQLEAGQALDWTAALMPLSVDAAAHDPDYHRATAAAEAAATAAMPAADFAALDRFMAGIACQPASTRLRQGNPWGHRHEVLTGTPLTAHLDLTTSHPRDFWDDLADGCRPQDQDLPAGFALSAPWLARLSRLPDDWRAALFLSIAALDQGDAEVAQALALKSLTVRESWLARRQVALTSTGREARDHYLAAWQPGAPDALAVEIADFLRQHFPDDLAGFLDRLPEATRRHERITLLLARQAADAGDTAQLAVLLARDFATIREGETLTDALWQALVRLKLTDRLGRTPDLAEMAVALADDPLPPHLDFRMQATENEVQNGAS
ncbi:MAG: DUF5107 domain-containing protein [Paracoccus sp. (in: a-proteobacteria)]|uniref:DUF5107 domain-containing protein n=1 Tax=Paracoccus sp. TaxID=267 RepID=UPI0026DFC9B4|nr:DUF5107 domain-containing protein [Paracoccus sp. (in: a-proteobacteria)]MDO5620752.1 DUF5107 domain-containing protein [Paracoccus sp. (in: a-proteobacteria)]